MINSEINRPIETSLTLADCNTSENGQVCQLFHNPLQVCHGDIKAENVMVTGWNWALLTDLASFKPVYLPEDNPADFNFFFDTSRRRTCYIAPERFLDSKQTEFLLSGNSSTGPTDSRTSSGLNLPDMDLVRHQRGELTPAMDIFSVG